MRYATINAVRLAADPSWKPADPVYPTNQAAPSEDASDIPDAQIGDALDQASALIDSYVGGRYATPIAPVDPQADPLAFPDPSVTYWARDIGLYLATLTWLRHADMPATDPVALRYAAAIGALTAVRDGKAVLNVPGQTGLSETGFSGIADPGTGGLFDAADAGYHGDRYYDRGPWQARDGRPW